ncbi:AAA ATPase-like protein [Desulfobotulus alkaliphilus]|uniref:AAA ATPase-like protein n=1 Tax=Desulfobotulus alkaliphilus TaxID=622671 RepID=A0A562S0G4_9BACT|nr:AAA ATPase-like protein [Desulfobotulus alkaliphilus]
MRIESLRLKNFKLFQDVRMSGISPFCVVVGANGTGKSTLFQVFGFLKDCVWSPTSLSCVIRGERWK